MPRKYALLRAALARNDLTQQDLANHLGHSYTYTNQRMAGRKAWNLDDVREIARWLQISREEIYDVFFA